MKGRLIAAIIAATVAVAPLAAFASPDEKGKGMEGHHLKNYNSKKSFEKFSKDIGLKGEQKEQMRKLLNDQAMKVEEFYKDARQKELQAIEETKTKGSEMLQGEQKAKFEKKMDKALQAFKKYMEKAGIQQEGKK